MVARKAAASRAGTTLTEVLVSLLVMSIGIVSLTSIFPLSLLRSVRASQLTNATIARYNCEAMLDADLSILRAVPANSKAVIDPLGHNILGGEKAAFQNIFGNDGTNVAGTLPRLNGGRTSVAAADFLLSLPDSWTFVFEGAGGALQTLPPAAGGPTQVDITGLSSTISVLPSSQVRVTLFTEGAAGRVLSVSRIATRISGNTVQWTEDVNGNGTLDTNEDLNKNGVLDHYALPAGFTVGRVRLDQQNRVYTWMVTARRGSTTSVALDVTVFFRRSFDIKDETVVNAVFQLGNRDVNITYTAGAAPFLKKGSYVFDVDNALWYRISEIKAQTTTSATLELDRPAAVSSPPAAANTRKAIFMKGIVEVFSIAPKDIAL